MRLFFLEILRSFLLQQVLLWLKGSSEKVTWWSVRVSLHWSDKLDDSCCWRDWKFNELDTSCVFFFNLWIPFTRSIMDIKRRMMTLLLRGFISSKLIPGLWLPPHFKGESPAQPRYRGREERKFERRTILNQVREKIRGGTIMILIMAIH